jgi:hypothetical protein
LGAQDLPICNSHNTPKTASDSARLHASTVKTALGPPPAGSARERYSP